MILVDSSVWIDFFRNKPTQEAEWLDRNLGVEGLVIGDLILAEGLQGFEESIRREQHQVSELQRLAEERQRKSLDDFLAEDEKRWKKQTLEWDHRWIEQDKSHRDLAVQFPPLRKEIEALKVLIRQLWRLQETYGSQRLQEAQRWLASLETALGDLPKEGR